MPVDHPASLLSDAGHAPAAIALALGMPIGKVYSTLRAERPNRTRAARRATSEVPARVVALAAAGMRVGRIAELKAYCYRILSDAS